MPRTATEPVLSTIQIQKLGAFFSFISFCDCDCGASSALGNVLLLPTLPKIERDGFYEYFVVRFEVDLKYVMFAFLITRKKCFVFSVRL
jgi:hypothetical protein